MIKCGFCTKLILESEVIYFKVVNKIYKIAFCGPYCSLNYHEKERLNGDGAVPKILFGDFGVQNRHTAISVRNPYRIERIDDPVKSGFSPEVGSSDSQEIQNENENSGDCC